MLRIGKRILNNFMLKMLALLLAAITWLYVTMELDKAKKIDEEEKNSILNLLQYEVISKVLPIKLNIVGNLAADYEFIKDKIIVKPEVCVIIGPKNLLENVLAAETLPIDISEYTKDVSKNIALAPISKGITLKEEFIKVFIPIVKKETAKDIPLE